MRFLFLFSCILFSYVGLAMASPKEIKLNVTNGLIIDYDSKTVLYNKNADKRIYPASLTKLMTLYIAFQEIQEGKLSLKQLATVSTNAYKKGNAATGGSTLFLEAGQKVRVEDLIKGIIVVSGNDASITLAELMAGSEESFVNLMNKKAKELGLESTHFSNSDGVYNKNHYSTTQDIVLLSYRIMSDFPQYYFLFSIKSFTYNGIKQYNRNTLLNYYDDSFLIDGIKTGHIDQSKYSLAFSAVNSNNDFRILGVLIGAPTSHYRKTEAAKAIRWVYKNFHSYTILKKGTVLAKIPVLHGLDYSYELTLDKDLIVILPKELTPKDLQVQLVHPRYILTNVAKGEKVAKVQVLMKDQDYKQYNISYDVPASEDLKQVATPLEFLLLPYNAIKKLLS